jgi:hypothetical protein
MTAMGQFWGLSISDDSLVPCAVRRHLPRVSSCTANSGSFGLGYYSRGELLQRQAPRCQDEASDLAGMMESIRADLLIMHARTGKDAAAKPEDIHPFRFKEWLFAHNGAVAGFSEIKERLLEAVPSFIRRNIKGGTDSEILFHLFLSFLYDAGCLNRPAVQAGEIGDAVIRTFATVDEFAHLRDIPPSAAAVIISDGYSLAVGSRGIPVDFAVIDGISDCERCRGSMRPGEPDSARVDHNVKAVIVCSCASAKTPSFRPLDDNCLLLVDKHQTPAFRAFG